MEKEKQKPGKRLGGMFNRNFQFRYWLDVTRIKSFTAYIAALFKRFFVPQPRAAEESFEAAAKRLNVTPEQLEKRQTSLFRLSLMMLGFAMAILIYAIYLMMFGGWRGVLVSFVVMLIALVLSFRYHFWYFQIKHKKLGCSFQEWLNTGLRGGKSS